MRTCLIAALLAVLAFATFALSASGPAGAQDYCYYSSAEQLWVCPPPRAYVGRSYARRCWIRNGRRVCRVNR